MVRGDGTGIAPVRHERDARRRRWTLLLMCVATFMIQLDVTVVNVALPRIQGNLGMTAGGLEWVIGAYALSLAALIPVGGALGDHYGRKRIFVAGMGIFTVGSIGCALSPTATPLITARAAQGVGGAAMLALTLSIITETFPTAYRAGAIGTWAAVGGTGFGVGPAAGGVLLTFFGWSSVFWVNVPFGLFGILGTARFVCESRNPHAGRLDALGVLLSATGLVGATLGLIEAASHPWGSAPVLLPLALGTLLLLLFTLWQRHTPHAMVPSRLLHARSFAVASAVYLLSYMTFSATLFYVSLLYQDVLGWSVLRTGLSWLFMNAPFLITAQFTGRLERRFTPTKLVGSGCVIGAIGIAALAAAGPSTPFALAAAGYLLSGAGFGAIVPALTHLAMRDVPAGVSGAASGVLNASRQIGTSIGLAVLGTIGVTATLADWHTRTQHLSAPLRALARQQAQQVAGAQIASAARTLGSSYRSSAVRAFMHGYHLAVGCAAGFLALAAAIMIFGLRDRSARSECAGQRPPVSSIAP